MRIGFDGSSILPRRTGVGHYTNQLLRQLVLLAPEHEFIVFLNSLRHAPRREPWMDAPNVRVRRGRFPGPALLYAWRWFNRPPIERLVGRVDLFHSPATYVPPQRAGARVTTVHDLYFLRDPETCERLGGRFLAATLPRCVRELDRILAASQSTRGDLIELLGVPAERIAVVYEGVDGRFARVEDPERRSATRARYELPLHYLLFVGTIGPRKNVVRLIEGYAQARAERADLPPLVVAGGRGKDVERVVRAVAACGVEPHVRFLGYVEHEDLPALYSGADVFVLPSLYEGFGLPVLEAMACGAPVVAGNNSSLRELVADRGFLVDAMRPSQIAGGILWALTDRNLREQYVRNGLAFARQMTWERCARETLEVYREAVEERRIGFVV